MVSYGLTDANYCTQVNMLTVRYSNVFLKLENLQPSGSFKSRGVGNLMVTKLNELRKSTGDDSAAPHFYCSSGGNAGLACVHAALTLRCQATIVVPHSTTPFMVQKLREAGATDVVQQGDSWQEADNYLTGTLMEQARERGEVPMYVPPFDHPYIWEGNAGITRETFQQVEEMTKHYAMMGNAAKPANVDAIMCSVGGGGMFCGIMQGIEELGKRNSTKVIAVETEGADALSKALEKKEHVTLPAITSLATSLGARRVAKQAFDYGQQENVLSVVLPDSDAMKGCKRFLDEEHYLVELACGVCPAVFYNGKLKEMMPDLNEDSVIVVVVCGGSNISSEILDTYMKSL